jgi:hypothetical protein
MTAKGGPFIVVVEADCLFERSAKVVSEARIAQMGCIGFLMQACRLIVYFLKIVAFPVLFTSKMP